MKPWHSRTVFCILIALLFTPSLHAQEGKEKKEPRPEKENWTYQVEIRHKDTRSEGWTGTLTRDGKEITGKAVGEIIDTPCGKFKWFGKPVKDEHPWPQRGWLTQGNHGTKLIDAPPE